MADHLSFKMLPPSISKIMLQNVSGSWFFVKGVEIGDENNVYTSYEVDLAFFIRQNSLWGFEE